MSNPSILSSRHFHPEALCCALLCVACGIVDAVGYIHHGLFTANMTGNTVLLGLAIAKQDWNLVVLRVAPLILFFGGCIFGRIILNLNGGRREWLALGFEAVLLGTTIFIDATQWLSVWIVAFAMGIQATAVTRFRTLNVSTVVVTSTIARMAEAVIDGLMRRVTSRPIPAPASTWDLLIGSWAAYLVGALIAGLLQHQSQVASALTTAMVLLAAIIIGRARSVVAVQ